MSTRVRAIEILRPGPPGEGMDPGQVAELEAFKDRTEAIIVDMARYMPVVSSHADAWQLAIDAAYSAGGGRVTTSLFGTHTMSKGMTLRDGVYVDGPGVGSLHLDFSSATEWVGGTFPSNISGEGTLTSLPALGSNATAGSAALTFSTAPSLSPGDEIILQSTVDYSFSPYRSYYKEGERCTVRTVSGTTVTLESRLWASHTAASTNVYKVSPIRTGISGMRLTGQAGKRLLRIALGSKLTIANLDLAGSNQSLVWLDRCYRSTVERVWGRDHQTSISLNYGLLIGNSQEIVVSHLMMDTTRHSFTCTGTDADGAIPNRAITVSDSTFGGSDPAYSGDLHGNSEWITFNNVRFPNGFQLGGDHTVFRGCEFRTRGLAGTGVTMGGSEMLGADHWFDGCRWVATANQSTDVAVVYIPFDRLVAEGSNAGNVAELTRTNGVLRVTDSEVVVGPYMHPSNVTKAFRIVSGANSDLPNDNDIEIDGLRVTTTNAANGQQGWGVAIEASAGRSFRYVAIDGVTGNLGILVTCGPKHLDLGPRNKIRNAFWRGLQVDWPAAPEWTDCLIHVKGGTYVGAYSLPIRLQGHPDESTVSDVDSTLIIDNVTALNANLGSLGNGHDDTLVITRFLTVIQRNCVLGDTQAVPTTECYQVTSIVPTWIDQDTTLLGSLTATVTSNVTARHFRGRGAGAPSFAAAVGSEYRRTDGGASTTLYINETGTTTWRAV